MIVYHGSSETVRQPDILHSYRALDFGRGFYVTTVREQAERWGAVKKVPRKSSQAGDSEAALW